jgi:hypothetical protein
MALYHSYNPAPTGGGLALGGSISDSANTVLMVSNHGALPPDPQGVVIKGFANILQGGTVGAITFTCYQGNGTGGTQVGSALVDYGPIVSQKNTHFFCFYDSAPTGDGQYTIAAELAGSTSAGTFEFGGIEVFVPQGSD